MASEIKPLLNALQFIKFTDRAIGNRFTEALHELDKDMDEETYEPSPAAESAYKKLAEEIEDAIMQEDEPPPKEPESINESDLPPEDEPELEELKDLGDDPEES